ncbi:MAG: flippase-like domain-containing protein [Crocinitomicaceae bacterium]|nr:flippase-like domain-containing protein [Crocinitomicaceae bacterium]
MTKTKKKTQIIKLVFGLALLLFIGWKVAALLTKNELDDLKISDQGLPFLLLIVALMPVNWLLESLKWQLLVKDIRAQKFGKTVKDVLAGVSTSILTPNRIGNFIGRTTDMEKDIRPKAIIATIHSNIAQFIASVLFGTIGLIYAGLNEGIFDVRAIYASAAFMILLSLFLYLYPKVIDINPFSRLYSEKTVAAINHIQDESLSLKFSVLGLSALRYSVFLLQFFLFLRFFGAAGAITLLVPAIAIVYLITTVVPSFLFGKLFVREASALFVLEAIGVQSSVIMATVFFLWMLNLGIPALVGGIILLRR